MFRLLRIEYSKLKHYNAFWIMNIAYMLMLPITMWGFSELDIDFWVQGSAFFDFPNVWEVGAYVASWFNFLLGIVIIIFTCNEFTNKTMRQNIIDGVSRIGVFKSKFVLIFAYALGATLYILIVSFLFGALYGSGSDYFSKISVLGLYLIQTFGYLTLALMFSFLLRKAGFTVILFIGIIFIEFIARAPMSGELAQYMPIRTMSKLVPIPYFEKFMIFMPFLVFLKHY